MKDKVSVIIPTFKRLTIKKAVDSVLLQDYPEIEVIVIDDNADYSDYRKQVEESLQPYVENKTVKLIQNEKNLGGSLTRNVGILASTGSYIAFLDDDDYYLPGKIKKQVAALSSTEAALVYCWSRGEDSNGKIVWENRKSKEGNLLVEAMTECIANTSLIMCKRDALEAVGLFTDTPSKQDVLLELKLASKGYQFVCVKEVLVVYGSVDPDVERISNVSVKTLRGFDRVRDYARSQYAQLSKKEIAFVEGDTAYKMCEVAHTIGDQESYKKEFSAAFRYNKSIRRRVKLMYYWIANNRT